MRLKELRKANGLSQVKLAQISGVKVRTIRNFEHNTKDINKANGEILYRLSIALNCKMEDLLEESICYHDA